MKIAKYLIIIFFLSFSYLFSYAYVTDYDDPFFKSGFYGGINYSNLSKFSSANGYESEVGYNIGFFTLFKVNRYLFIQPEITFSQKSFRLDNFEKEVNFIDNAGLPAKAIINYNKKYTIQYFSVPLLVKLNIAPFFDDETANKLFILAGPVMNISTSAKQKNSYWFSKNNYFSDIKNIDFTPEETMSIDVNNFQMSYFTGISFEHNNLNFGIRYEKFVSRLSDDFDELVSYSLDLSIFLEFDKQKWQRIKNNIVKNGVFYGFGMSSYLGNDAKNSSFIPSQSLGLYLTYKLSKWLYFQPEILFTTKGAKDKTTQNKEIQKIVQVPFLLKYYTYSRSVIKPNFLLGPSFNFNLEKSNLEYTTNKDQGLSDYNFSLIGGAGIDFHNSSFDFRINYGLTNVYDKSINKKDISFMLTYQNIGTFDNFIYRFKDFGIKTSAGISDITGKKNINSKTFFAKYTSSLEPEYKFSFSNSVGAYISYALSDNLSFQPEIFYSIQRSTREYQTISATSSNIELKNRDRVSASYLEIPLLLKYNYYKNYSGILNPYVFVGATPCQLSSTKYTEQDTINKYYSYEEIEKKSHIKYMYGLGFDFDRYLVEVRYSTNFLETGENSAELLFGARFSINHSEYDIKNNENEDEDRTSLGLKAYWGLWSFGEESDKNKNLKANSYVFGTYLKNRINEFFNFQYEMLFSMNNYTSDSLKYVNTDISFPILAKLSYFNDIDHIVNPAVYFGSSYHFALTSNASGVNNKENYVDLIAGTELNVYKYFSLDLRFSTKANSMLKTNNILLGLNYTF